MDAPRVGATHETKFIVEPKDTVSFPGLPPVVATPSLIWHMEMTAYLLLKQVLPAGRISVGTRVEIDHLAPAPEGAEITCRARVINVDGPHVTFQVEAADSIETLSRGLHKRYVVDAERMVRRISLKTSE